MKPKQRPCKSYQLWFVERERASLARANYVGVVIEHSEVYVGNAERKKSVKTFQLFALLLSLTALLKLP